MRVSVPILLVLLAVVLADTPYQRSARWLGGHVARARSVISGPVPADVPLKRDDALEYSALHVGRSGSPTAAAEPAQPAAAQPVEAARPAEGGAEAARPVEGAAPPAETINLAAEAAKAANDAVAAIASASQAAQAAESAADVVEAAASSQAPISRSAIPSAGVSAPPAVIVVAPPASSAQPVVVERPAEAAPSKTETPTLASQVTVPLASATSEAREAADPVVATSGRVQERPGAIVTSGRAEIPGAVVSSSRVEERPGAIATSTKPELPPAAETSRAGEAPLESGRPGIPPVAAEPPAAIAPPVVGQPPVAAITVTATVTAGVAAPAETGGNNNALPPGVSPNSPIAGLFNGGNNNAQPAQPAEAAAPGNGSRNALDAFLEAAQRQNQNGTAQLVNGGQNGTVVVGGEAKEGAAKEGAQPPPVAEGAVREGAQAPPVVAAPAEGAVAVPANGTVVEGAKPGVPAAIAEGEKAEGSGIVVGPGGQVSNIGGGAGITKGSDGSTSVGGENGINIIP